VGEKKEMELKIRLDERSYLDLQTYLEKYARHLLNLVQTNYYLDTRSGDFLNRKEMIRVREQDGDLILTHKSRVELEAGYFQSHEKEYLLTLRAPVHLSEVMSQIPAYLPEAGEDLICLGTMKNFRQVYHWEGFTLELDCSRYGDFDDSPRDWELECETEEPGILRNKLLELFSKLGIVFQEQTETKFKRFMNIAKARSDKDIGVR